MARNSFSLPRWLTKTAAVALPFALVSVESSPAHAQASDRMLFVTTYPNAAQGFVSSMRINLDGSLTLIDTVTTSDTGPQAISVSRDGSFLAVSHGTSKVTERVDIFRVNPDGTLEMRTTIGVPDSPLDLIWLTDRELAVSQTSFGGSNSVGVYRYDADANTLVEIDREDAGAFQSDLAFDPQGRVLFANDSLTNQIFVFTIDEDGRLTLDTTNSTSGIYPLGMDVSLYGDFLYAGGGISSNSDKVLGYEFAGVGESLISLPGAPYLSPGNSPKQALPMREDQIVCVGHGYDATVRTFEMADDGSLTSTGRSFDVGERGTLGKLTALGDLLFAPDNSTLSDGKSGIYVLRVSSDGTFSMVGDDLYDTGLSTPNSVAVWDPQRGTYLRVKSLIAGETASFEVSTGIPNLRCALAYSITGPGRRYLPLIQTAIDLQQPKQLGPIRRTDASGATSWNIVIPDSAKGVKVWLQALQFRRVSNLVGRTVE